MNMADDENDDVGSTAAVDGDREHPDELLLHAANAGDWTLMERALRSGANANAKSKANHRRTALHKVLLREHWNAALCFLEASAREIDLEATDSPNGDTALSFAGWRGNLEMVQKLVSLGANLQHRNNLGKTVFLSACIWGNLDVVKFLLAHCEIDLQATDRKKNAALHSACKSGNHEIAALLLDHHHPPGGAAMVRAILGAKNYRGDTPLHRAAKYADARMVRLLLDRVGGEIIGGGGARSSLWLLSLLNEQNHNRQTALHSAVRDRRHSHGEAGAVAIVQELVQRGTDVSLQDHKKRTPFDIAFQAGATKLCGILRRAYRDQMLERNGDLALHAIFREAVYSGDARDHAFRVRLPVGALSAGEFANLLRSFDAGLFHSRNPATGLRPVHVACSQGAPAEILQVLVLRDPRILDPTIVRTPSCAGALPLHLACSRGRADLATLQYLVEHGGADTLRARDRDGALPLHRLLGAKRKRPGLEAVKLLLHAYPGALSVATHQGDLPIMVASRMSCSLDVLLLLLKASPEVVSL